MSRDHQDMLIDQMLRELLGGDRPRDITQRVLARARTYDKVRRHWWMGVGSAIAASLALGITLWSAWPRPYPGVTVTDGLVDIDNQTETIQRGSRLVTPEDASASITLGGYVDVEMAPKTILTIGGSRFAEKVFLEQGQLDVNVVKNRGRFEVAVGKAHVLVTGTRFEIGVSQEESDDRRTKRLRIAVKEGSVAVGMGDSPAVTLAADSALSEKVFDLSSEPTRVAPPALASNELPRAGARTGAVRGGALGTGEGGRPGLIGSNYITGTAPRNPAPPALGAPAARGGRPPAAPPPGGRGNVVLVPGRNMQVVLGPGDLELTGTLRREGDRGVLYLELDNGTPVLLFAQQAAPPPARVYTNHLGKRMKVKWADGEFREMVLAEPVNQSGIY